MRYALALALALAGAPAFAQWSCSTAGYPPAPTCEQVAQSVLNATDPSKQLLGCTPARPTSRSSAALPPVPVTCQLLQPWGPDSFAQSFLYAYEPERDGNPFNPVIASVALVLFAAFGFRQLIDMLNHQPRES